MTQKTTEELAQQEALDKLIDELEKKGIHPTRLAIFHVGADQIMAEMEDDEDFDELSEHVEKYKFVCVNDPKRILRLQQVQGGGVVLSYMMGDFDLVERGEINIAPTCWYRVASQSPKSAYAILTLYKEYLDRRMKHKAEDAGLVLPERGVASPFKR